LLELIEVQVGFHAGWLRPGLTIAAFKFVCSPEQFCAARKIPSSRRPKSGFIVGGGERKAHFGGVIGQYSSTAKSVKAKRIREKVSLRSFAKNPVRA